MKRIQKTINTYEFSNGFIVEISKEEANTEFWIYHKMYGIKEMMFGIPNEYAALNEEIMLANVQQHMDYYEEEYMGY